jgi:predicted nucleotidyltransferase
MSGEKNMKKIEEIKDMISCHMDILTGKYNVKIIGIFGSHARNEQKEGSDVDILIEFVRPIGLVDFVELGEYLQDVLGSDVDIVLRDDLVPKFRDLVLHEVVYL